MTGKTIGALRRNVIAPLKRMMLGRGIQYVDHRSDNMIEVAAYGHINYYYLFGGKDEASQDLVQGITAGGAYFDEVALQPESFVNQAVARCSEDGSKLWFNCNPESPAHWFKVKWLDRSNALGIYVLHFLMDDNPSLTEATKARFMLLFANGSVFYKRFILGLWVIAEGAIYDMFSTTMHVATGPIPPMSLISVGVDYGTVNPTAFEACGLVTSGVYQGKWMFFKEFYNSTEKSRKTDAELSKEMLNYLRGLNPQYINVDPSAASFKEQLRREGVARVNDADNAVLDGIRKFASGLSTTKIVVHESCQNLIKEMTGYTWDPTAQEKGIDKPIKVNDHALDAARYAYMRVASLNVKA